MKFDLHSRTRFINVLDGISSTLLNI